MSRHSQGVNRQRTVTSSSFQEDTEGENDEDTKTSNDYGAPKTPRSAAHPSSSAAHPSSSAAYPSSSAAHPSSSTAYHEFKAAILATAALYWQRAAIRPYSGGRRAWTHDPEATSRRAQIPLFFSVPDEYKELVRRAASHVRHYTLFGNPMLNAEEIQQLLSVTWVKAQEETGETLPCLKIATSTPELAHILFTNVNAVLWASSGWTSCPTRGSSAGELSPIPGSVHLSGRWTRDPPKAFPRERNNRNHFLQIFLHSQAVGELDESFFDAINEVFICLVTSAMRHCLKAWMTGVYVEPPSVTKFKYDSTVSSSLSDAYSNVPMVFGHLECPPKESTYAPIGGHKGRYTHMFGRCTTKGCLESDQPLEVGDTSAFEAELMQELLQATEQLALHGNGFPTPSTGRATNANSNSHVETDVEAAEHETDNELEEETDDD
ncbi:hypothetical protein BGX38DRAFT_1280580 [Terfezia claveryi]|nr:hypothetical protein BGX38DRAFT_1280580 [Terfezia claveryi]